MLIWMILAGIILIIELSMGTIYLLVIALSFFFAGLSHLIFSEGYVSIFVAAILSAIGIWIANKLIKNKKVNPTEQNMDLDIGNTVQVRNKIGSDVYQVFYRGTIWQAKCNEDNDSCYSQVDAKIIGKSGNILLISFIKNQE